MNKITIGFLASFTLLTSGCDWLGIRGNGHIITDQRSITEFTEIAGSGGLRIEWHSGPPALSITTDENLVSYVENRTSGDVLRLRTRDRVRPTHGVKVTVSSAKLNGADFSGAVNLIAKSVAGPKFYVRARGASDITVDGTAEQFLADLTGAADLKAKGLQAKTVEISTTGAAHRRVKWLRPSPRACGKTCPRAASGAGERSCRSLIPIGW